MNKRSENRPFELSNKHYAKHWPTKKYKVEETNKLAIEFTETEDEEKRKEISLEIIRRFHSFLYKFMKLLITGKADLNNKYQKQFLNLFMVGGARPNAASYKAVAQRSTIVFRQDDPDDIYDQLAMVFLQLLAAYNQSLNIGVVYYFNYFFKYHLKKYMVNKYYDALDYQYIDSADAADYFSTENRYEGEGPNSGRTRNESRLAVDCGMFEEPAVEDNIDNVVHIADTKDIGSMNSLSQIEKYILYLLVQGNKCSDIMQLLGLSNNKFTSLRNSIKKKVSKARREQIDEFSEYSR